MTGATDAVVARIHGYAETSAVAVLLTADHGAVSAVAKGAKRISNGFRGPLDRAVLYRVRLGAPRSGGLHHLRSASVREAYPRLGLFARVVFRLDRRDLLAREGERLAGAFAFGRRLALGRAGERGLLLGIGALA